MRVLFIGGTGLISTAIARQLLEAGHEVTLYNRGKSNNRLPLGATQIIGDRKDYTAFEAQFADTSYDIVVDMVGFHPDDAASAIRAFQGRVKQFIFCSTVCVYSGPVQTIPTPESEPYHSIGDYGKNKVLCELALLHAHEAEGFPVTIMRPSHSYGEGGGLLRPFGSWETFVDRLRKGKPIIVNGDGNGLWASCHVDDVARGFIATMENPTCIGQAYNITGDEWMSWNMYHEQVAEVVGGKFDPVYIPWDILYDIAPNWTGGTREIFAWPSIFNNDKLKRDTDYTGQTVSWKEGVKRNLAWLETQNRLKDSDTDTYEDTLIAAWRENQKSLPRHEAAG